MATQNYKKFINKITTATTATPETGEIIVGPDQFYVGLGDGTTYSSKNSSGSGGDAASAASIKNIKYYGDPDIEPSPDSYFILGADQNNITGLADEAKTKLSIVIPYEINGNVINTLDGNLLHGTSIETVILPNTITGIGQNAFAGSSLSSVNIPDSVYSIGDGAFSSTQLTKVTIPGSVKTIGSGAFNTCTKLEEVIISNGVTTIKDQAFTGCSSLSSVHVPSSITTLNSNAFDSATTNPGIWFYLEQGAYVDSQISSANKIYTEISDLPTVYPKTATYIFAAEDTIDKEGAIVNNNVGKAVSDLLASDDFVEGSTIFIRTGTYTTGIITLQDKECRITGEGARTTTSNLGISFADTSLSRIEIDHLGLYEIAIHENTNISIHDNYFNGIIFNDDVTCDNFDKKIEIYNNVSNTLIASFKAKTKGVNIYNNTCMLDPIYDWGGQTYIAPDNMYKNKSARPIMFSYGSLVSSNGDLVLATLKKYCSNATTANYQNIITGTATTDATTTGVNPTTSVKYLRDDDGNKDEGINDSYTKFVDDLWNVLGQSIYDDNNISWDTLADRKKEIAEINDYNNDYRENMDWYIILENSVLDSTINQSDIYKKTKHSFPEDRTYKCDYSVTTTTLQNTLDKIFANSKFVEGDHIIIAMTGDIDSTASTKLVVNKSCKISYEKSGWGAVDAKSAKNDNKSSFFSIASITINNNNNKKVYVELENMQLGDVYANSFGFKMIDCTANKAVLNQPTTHTTYILKGNDITNVYILGGENDDLDIVCANNSSKEWATHYSFPRKVLDSATNKYKYDGDIKDADGNLIETATIKTPQYKNVIIDSLNYNHNDVAWQIILTNDKDGMGYMLNPMYFAVPPERRFYYNGAGNNPSYITSLQSVFDSIFAMDEYKDGDRILLTFAGYLDANGIDITQSVSLTLTKNCAIICDQSEFPYLSYEYKATMYKFKNITIKDDDGNPVYVGLENLVAENVYGFSQALQIKNCFINNVIMKQPASSAQYRFMDSTINNIKILTEEDNKNIRLLVKNCIASNTTVRRSTITIEDKVACTEEGLTGKYKYGTGITDASGTLITSDDNVIGYFGNAADLDIYSNFWDIHNEPVIATAAYEQLDKSRIIKSVNDSSIGVDYLRTALDEALKTKEGTSKTYRLYKHITFAENNTFNIGETEALNTYTIATGCHIVGPSSIVGNLNITSDNPVTIENISITGKITLAGNGHHVIKDCDFDATGTDLITISSDMNKIHNCTITGIKFTALPDDGTEVTSCPSNNIIVNNISPSTHTAPTVSYESDAVQTGVTGKNLIS